MTTDIDTPPEPATFALKTPDHDERRKHVRRAVRIRAEARRLDQTELAKRMPRVGLGIANLSEGGLAAVSRCPIGLGERLSIQLPDSFLGGARKVVGTIVRCDLRDRAWHIGLRFD
jgi:hypothetical protein